MDKVFVVQGVAKKLWSAETALDSALSESATLMNSILAAREELQVSHMVVDPAVHKVSEAVASMAQARRALMEAHVALAEAKLRVGVRTKLVGIGSTINEDYRAFTTAIAPEAANSEDRRSA